MEPSLTPAPHATGKKFFFRPLKGVKGEITIYTVTQKQSREQQSTGGRPISGFV